MITQENIDRFYKDVEGLKLKFPVAAIALATGESKGNVSRYLNKKLEPSEPFLIKFYESFKIVPREIYEGRKPDIIMEGADLPNLYERLIEEKERGRLRAEKQADEYMQIIKDNLTALLLNSAKSQELLIKIWDEQTSDDLVMMNNQDVDSGKPAGTSAEISGNLQKALVTERKKVPQKSETGKREKAGK